MNYSELSDSEIESRVFQIAESELIEFCTPFLDITARAGALKPYKYCSSWEYAGPIIESEKIDLIYEWDRDEEWTARDSTTVAALHGNNEIFGVHKNPLRAAMICYLMMKENEE